VSPSSFTKRAAAIFLVNIHIQHRGTGVQLSSHRGFVEVSSGILYIMEEKARITAVPTVA
jgi:hypothetical protein